MKAMFFYSSKHRTKIRKRLILLFVILLISVFLFVWIAGMRDVINKHALNRLEYLVTNIIDE